MNQHAPISNIKTGHSACPHDCPSTCALDVEILDERTIGRVRGAKDNSYTAGVICAKVARYAERVHHPDRLKHPLVRAGAKGAGQWKEASWEAALDLIAERFLKAEHEFGSESVWPYYYAGTMGLVQRDSINRLRFAKRYSNQFDSFCTNMAWTGYFAGTGSLTGPDPREMAKADVVVIWGTNAAATQVNVMTHAVRARKERGAKIVVIDVYANATVRQADMGIVLKPGTDGAFACAVMHVLFRDGLADWDYLERYTDDPKGLEAHLQTRTPEWAAAITGLSVEEIEAFAHLVGKTKRTYFRLGYGFTRQRNGAVNMHAASSIACVTGAFLYEGGGAFHSNSGIFKMDKREIEGRAMQDVGLRFLDQSKIGRILTGDSEALYGGPPVMAMLIQNTNPMNVTPEQRLVRKGFAREDLFVAVHEQFMTDTAKMADVVLPATTFLEHDDIYRGGGQQHVVLGPKLIEPLADARPNIFVINELAKRLGVAHLPGFDLDERTLIDNMNANSDLPQFDELKEKRFVDLQPPFEEAHYINGFKWPDGKFRFRPDWTGSPSPNKPPEVMGLQGPFQSIPEFPDHWEVIETADAEHPFRMTTSPAHNFLNSTFAETPTSLAKEIRPELLIHPDDAAELGIENGERIEIGNHRGELVLHAVLRAGQKRGVAVSEGIFPNSTFERGEGINILIGAEPAAPYGGLAVHDTKIWIRKINS
ncbi:MULTISPECIES: molybdopterin oxidoreductase family protein [Brucella]|uniref:Molybdopterin oxidoreductase Fe4S4 domain protein n=1 Tax=Brucella lupini TaxID=255457 RepID=A0A256GN15_9HYPH|nr:MULTISPECIES: molybdopterin oxidoreductase family protein [Brucella/Ochrobactrum group]RNL41254.1 molybdopterin oxidoreductase family protein [Ochrobactrum sp. MH181795]AIK44946.1 molybdopterin oxidoreductase Fe4S4 domain protein [Brucella anthropi]KAB2701448.1 molybdopterin oxidoreductase family protein [Brucella lupini]KAB2723564.1 molybdopterin oxidoreductase family protein [Brucella anthropi]KAB2736609.1 molybdopterin oxidoreductase family protein [Brucella anthropi]